MLCNCSHHICSLSIIYGKFLNLKVWNAVGDIVACNKITFIFTENTNPDVDKNKIKRISTRVLIYVLILFFAALPCKKCSNIIYSLHM